MEKYNKVLSSNYCISIFDGTHDSPKYVLEGFPLVTSKCLINNNIDSSVASLIGQKDYDDVNKRSKVEQNDILISMIGINAGIVGLIKNKPEYAIKNVGVFRCKDCIEAKYLFYYLQSDLGINELKSSMAGSAQPYITLEKLRSLSILVPINRIQQQHIVNTIGTIDDLIENLNKQLDKIEEILSNLFVLNNSKATNINNLCNIKYGKNLVANELSFNYLYPVYGSNGIIGTLSTYEHSDYKISISCRGASSGSITLTEPKSTISSNSLYLDLKEGYEYMLPSILFSLKSIGLNSYTTGSAQPQITIDNLKTLYINICEDKSINEKAYKMILLRSNNIKLKKWLYDIKKFLLDKYF